MGPALRDTGLVAEVVWLGHVPDRKALESGALAAMALSFAGPRANRMAG